MTGSELTTFLENLERWYGTTDKTGSFFSLREKFWLHFGKLGLAHKGQEAFQYVPLSQLYSQQLLIPSPGHNVSSEDILPHIYPESRENYLVLVNGFFCKELSRSPLLALPLEQAMGTYGTFLNQRFGMQERNPFVSLNGALHGKGLFLYIPPGVQVEAPVQCIHLITEENSTVFPRTHIVVGKGSEIQWIDTLIAPEGASFWCSGLTDVALEENASFLGFSSSRAGWHFTSVRATLKGNSRFKYVTATTGAECARQDFHVMLKGEGAEADLQGIARLKSQEHSHVHVFMEHIAPHCRSTQLFKGVVEDSGRSSFEGKIFVHKEAQKTEAYQSNHNLVLGERALAYSKPNLEIFADDVKASHGATVSQLDEQHLFYMQTRGFSKEDAKRHLIRGFCLEILKQIPIHSSSHPHLKSLHAALS